jgi:hypothetical protein
MAPNVPSGPADAAGQAAVSKEPLRLLFVSPATLEPMTRGKQTTALAVAGAIALASGAYALGTQVDDGTAAAHRGPDAGFGYGPGRPHGPGVRPGFDALAEELGVEEDTLRDALEDIAADRRTDFAPRLAAALGIEAAKVEQALEDARPERPHVRRPGAVAAALAKELGLSAAKVRAALRQHRGDLADALGVSEERLREAFHAVMDEQRPPRFGNLAEELGVTQAELDAAFEKLRGEKDDFAQELADRLNLDVAKVQEALEDLHPPRFGRHRP